MILFLAICRAVLIYLVFFRACSHFSGFVHFEYSKGSFFLFVTGLFRVFSSTELLFLCGSVLFSTP